MTTDFVSYLRVSTSRQGSSGLGLEAQREAVARHISSLGGRVVSEYQEVETGRGANALSCRPELRRALDFARRNRLSLVVAKLDRLTRSARLLLELVESSRDVGLVFCDLPSVPCGPVGKFMLTQLAAVAEFEAGIISQRTRDALAAAKARGVRLGRHGEVLASQRRAEALAFALKVAPELTVASAGSATLASIAEDLNERGVPTPHGGAWHPTSVARVKRRIADAQRRLSCGVGGQLTRHAGELGCQS